MMSNFFNPPHESLPYRPTRTDLARMQAIRGMTRRRTGPSPGIFDDMFRARRDALAHDYPLGYGPASPYNPSPFSRDRFEDVSDTAPLQRSQSASDYTRPSYRREDYGYDARDAYESPRSQPFEKAAANAHAVLNHAWRFVNELERNFDSDTFRIAEFADPRLVDVLWTQLLNWNGVAAGSKEAQDNHAAPPPGVKTYREHTKRVLRALEELKRAAPPRMGLLAERKSKVSPEEVKTTLRKLQVSVPAIVEFLETVKGNRKRCAVLVKEIGSAMILLGDVRDLWEEPKDDRDGKRDDPWSGGPWGN